LERNVARAISRGRSRLAIWAAVLLGAPPVLALDAIQFSRDIQPILADHCFKCHGPDAAARQAELRLDIQESALRTESPVIVPGHSDQSELIRRITATDPDEQMPPPGEHPLTSLQVERLRRWIDQGAAWGKHWAFEPPRRPAVPPIEPPALVRNPIDAFVLARLKAEGLAASPEAPRETLIRRLTLDLTGLPPSLEEVDAFLADTSGEAYEKVIDRLLASPRFGERMVWPWLEAARYADTNGYQGDPTRPMFYWRDWVIDALNRNMPFDQFTIEQLAGDLLPNPTQAQLVATGFHRNHMINGEGGRIAEESRVDYVQDRVETTGTVWLGLTLNCCRCHDHKFDPLTQREYYQLAAYFNSVDESGGNDAGGLANPIVRLATADQEARLAQLAVVEQEAGNEVERIEAQLRALPPDAEPLPPAAPDDIKAILAKNSEDRSESEQKALYEYRRDHDESYLAAKKRSDKARGAREAFEKSLPRTMIMRDRAEPRPTYVLIRGAYDKYGEPVTHGVPAILSPLPPDAPANRLALARWLVSPENPLTARVTVNRYWQMFFGQGLVKTVEDFGVQGERPSHPELLDWLACEFVSPTVSQPTVANATPDNRFNVKHLLRLIVTSATYRQSSRATPDLNQRDPQNRLLARGPRFRLPSWMIRDQALAASGLLVEKLGGPPVKGYQPPGIWEEATFGKIAYEPDHGDALYRRSVYQFWRRIVGPTVFFDAANRQTCQVKSSRTNTPLHALVTLNDVTYVEAARALAQRVLQENNTTTQARLESAYRRVLARRPEEFERQVLEKLLATAREQFTRHPDSAARLLAVGESKRDESLNAVEHAAYTVVSSTILNMDEALNKE
jgi:hypothetical protein